MADPWRDLATAIEQRDDADARREQALRDNQPDQWWAAECDLTAAIRDLVEAEFSCKRLFAVMLSDALDDAEFVKVLAPVMDKARAVAPLNNLLEIVAGQVTECMKTVGDLRNRIAILTNENEQLVDKLLELTSRLEAVEYEHEARQHKRRPAAASREVRETQG